MRFSKILLYGGSLGAAGLVVQRRLSADPVSVGARPKGPPVFDSNAEVPTRAAQLASLQRGTADDPFDVLIIGGGATGTGCAVDAVSRCVCAIAHAATLLPRRTVSRSCSHQHAGPRASGRSFSSHFLVQHV